jgi:2,3-dihydroxybenzoate-AMP ligase
MPDGYTLWPAAVAAHYRAQGYWRGETLADLLRGWSRRYATRAALVHSGRRITYAELDHRVDRMAGLFARHGIEPGDRVVLQLPNVPEFVIACFALFRLDAKPVFSLPAHRASEIGHLCAVSGATGYVAPGRYQGFDYRGLAAQVMADSPALRRVFVLDAGASGPGASGSDERLAGAVVPLDDAEAEPVPTVVADPSDVAFFLLSGGTTALPKLIPRTHDDYAYQVRAASELIGLSPGDVYLAVLPASFNFTWGCPGIVGTLASGGTVVLADDAEPDECFAAIASEQVTVTSLVPAIAQFWLEAADEFPAPVSRLRLIQIGGAPLAKEIAERITPVFGCALQQVYGMAEGLLAYTRETDPPEAILTTQGRPLSPDDEVRIADDAGLDLPPGQVGEVHARGPYTIRGYYRAPEHNARAFTDDGFYRTGDLARRTPSGDLVIEGRIKDVIIRGGNKIAAAEVEEHLLALPSVDRAAVVPVPDPRLGERICAYVRPCGDPPTLPELRAALLGRGIASYKLPDRLEIVADLPLTGLGKVDKKRLMKDAAAKFSAG